MRARDHSLSEIPLLPDSELLKMMEEAEEDATALRERARDRNSRRRSEQAVRRLEALARELKDRGIQGPPWWVRRERR